MIPVISAPPRKFPHLTLEQALERAEDAHRVALAIYDEMRALREQGLWNRERNRRWAQLGEQAHAMGMRYADLRADAMMIEAEMRKAA